MEQHLLQHAFRLIVDAFNKGNDSRGIIVKILYIYIYIFILKVCKALAGSSKALSSLILVFYDVYVTLQTLLWI